MIIFRYLVREVYGMLLACTGVLLLLLISNQFIHYLRQAAAGILPLYSVLQLASLQMPLLLGILMPLGLYLGILIAYGRLYTDREMVVLFSCGFSKKQLLGRTLGFSAVVCVIIALLTTLIQPKMEVYKRHIVADAAAASPLERATENQFMPLADGKLVFYTQDLSRDHKQLQQVFAAQRAEDASGWNIIVAERGEQRIDPQTRDRFLELQDGYRYIGMPGADNFQAVQYKTYGIRIEKSNVSKELPPEALSTGTLWEQRHGHRPLQAELQWRLALPLSGMILALLAVALSEVDPRQGRYAQLVPAFLLYILYINLLLVSRSWLEKGQISSGIGLWWVHGLMLLITAFLLWRFMRQRR